MTYYEVEYTRKVELGASCSMRRPCYFSTLRKAKNFIRRLKDCNSQVHRTEIPAVIVKELYQQTERKRERIEKLQSDYDY